MASERESEVLIPICLVNAERVRMYYCEILYSFVGKLRPMNAFRAPIFVKRLLFNTLRRSTFHFLSSLSLKL